jgi:uncharacterized protein (DUF1778 family)
MPAITIRDVPEPDLLNLKRKAAAAGKSLQTFLLDVISREAKTATLAEVMDRMERQASAELSTSDILEAIDGARERRW